jgi:GNAT superfamily N-acetyltransferase
MSDGFRIRAAVPADMPAVFRLVRALAAYEKMEHRMTATEADLREALFGAVPRLEAALAEDADGRAVGIALFYEVFSTFSCARGLYLEDLFVDEAARGKGMGKALIAWGAKLAVSRGCTRYQWVVLDWNKPARDFYRSLGAFETPEWIGVRLMDEPLRNLAAQAPA